MFKWSNKWGARHVNMKIHRINLVKCKSMTWWLWRVKADWIGFCHVTVHRTTWLAQCYCLNPNFSFLNWILLHLISYSYSIASWDWMNFVLDPRYKLKFLTFPGIKCGPLGYRAGTVASTPRWWMDSVYKYVWTQLRLQKWCLNTK